MSALSRPAWAIAAFTLVAGLLRFATLGMQSFWSDEAVTELLVRMDVDRMLDLIPESESTPPLYYLLAWPWTRVFGFDEVGFRSLSALAGTAAVPLAAAAAWKLASRRAAVATAAVVAVNPLLIWYSQEARAYSLLVLFVTLSFLSFVHALDNPRRVWLTAWCVASLLAAATHYFGLFVVLPEAVLLLVVLRRRAVGAVAIVCLGTAALAPLALAQRGTGAAEWISRGALGSRIATAAKQLLIGRDSALDRPFAILAALLALAAIALLVRRADARSRRGAAIAGAVGVGALLVPLALAIVGLDYVIAQNVLAAIVPLSVALSIGFAVPEPRWLAGGALACFCALSLGAVVTVASDAAYQRADWRGAAEATARLQDPRVIVLDNDFGGWFARLPFRLYLPAAVAVDKGLATVPQDFPERLRRRPQDEAMPRDVRTRELVFVNFGGESTCGIGRVRVFDAFRLVESDDSTGYDLLRYRSAVPVAVRPRDLAACLGRHEVAILRQP